MNVNHILWVNTDDPLNRFRDFLYHWWERISLKAMLVPMELNDGYQIVPQVIENPVDLAAANPFAPFMSCNAASAVFEFLRDYPRGPLAVILRPCELRTLVELQKRHRIPIDSVKPDGRKNSLIIIGMDCTGTFSANTYRRHVEQLGVDRITNQALVDAPEEVSLFSQLRTACQICNWPTPWNADITIGSIGVIPDRYMLVIARDELTDSLLALGETTDRLATEVEVVRREAALGRIADMRATRQASMNIPVTRCLGDFGSLLACFARCTLCADCLDACPLYEGELSGLLGVGGAAQRGRPSLAELVAVSRWLSSCSGCGMCEEACQQGVELSRLVSILSHHIQDELHYRAGKPEQNLPWDTS